MMQAGFGSNAVLVPSTYRPGNAWLFIRNSPSGPVKGALELNRQQASELVKMLHQYIDEVDNA